MKITDVTCTVAVGGPFGERGTPIVRVYSEDGLWGCGESSPMHPFVTREFIHRQLKPLLVGLDALDIEACWEKMYVTTKRQTCTYLSACASSDQMVGSR